MSKLYLIPTPIGNLEDITYRAISVLKMVDTIIAEDTRVTSKLLKHYGITKPMVSYHKFNEHRIVDRIIDRIELGETFALVSDAGTPSISDPGFLIIRLALKHGIEIECLPGATALIPAIVLSGLPNDRFCFEGFLPVKKGRQKRLEELREEKRTMIFYESPHRIKQTLEQFKAYFGVEREISISREISKLHEETIRGTLGDLLQIIENKPPKGEIVICVAGKSD